METLFINNHYGELKFLSNKILNYENYQTMVSTRRQTTKATSSCRLWQLVLCILNELEKRNKDVVSTIVNYSKNPQEYFVKYEEITELVRKIMRSILNSDPVTNPNHELYNMIVMNNTESEHLVELDLTYESIRRSLRMGINYLCIYIEKVDGDDMTNFSILHYFSIIKVGANLYDLNSSYGSDYVCVPQYTTKLNLTDFVRFVNALNNPYDDDFFRSFFVKYFLKYNTAVRYSEDDIDANEELKTKWITPDEGSDMEISRVFVENRYRYNMKCGIIPQYDALVDMAISYFNHYQQSSSQLGGKRRYYKKTIRRGRINKVKHINRTKRVRKTTKRRRSSRSSKRCSR